MSWGLPEEEMKRLDLSSLYKQAWDIRDSIISSLVFNNIKIGAEDDLKDFKEDNETDKVSLSESNQDNSQETYESTQETQVIYPTVEDIYEIHEQALLSQGGLSGDKDDTEGKIEAAIGRSQSEYFGSSLYPTLVEKASSLMHSIVTTHPFVDANKRTAYLTGITFLHVNGISLEDSEELADLLIQVADSTTGKSLSDIISHLQYVSIKSKLSWQLDEDYVTEKVNNYGNLVRLNYEGQFHSLYSPAIEYSDGSKDWYQNGKRHRLDGPAIEYSDGSKDWYQNGKLHRLDGPAIEWSNSYKEWWYEGKFYGNCNFSAGYNQEQFEQDLRNEGKIASMKQEKDELFICLWAPDDVYKRFSHIKDLDKELHVTLIYRKDIKTTKELNDSLLSSIAKICDEVGTIKCKATGIGTFNNDDKSDAILINCVKGATIYEKLVDLVTNLYGEWEINYGYLPHMTLKYEGTGEVNLKKFKPFSWNVKHIGVRIGDDSYLVNVKTGEYKKTKQILSSVEDSSNILENSLPENSNSFFMPKEDKEIKRTNPKRYDKITDIYDTTDSNVSNRTDNPILGIASQKLSWQTEEDFVTEEVDSRGDLVRRNSDNELHSLYSPAIEYSDGDKFWYQNGNLHRLDGPAIEYTNGDKVWYYEGKRYDNFSDDYDQEKFEQDLRNEGKIASQKFSWGEEDFVREYTNDRGNLIRKNSEGKLHSLYSPAIEYSDGHKRWYQNDKLHRLDGPAIEWSNSYKEWWYEGKFYGDSREGYTQEDFENDLRNEGKIASQKLSWGDDNDTLHNYVFTEKYSKSIMPSNIDHSSDVQEKLLKSIIEKTIQDNNLDVVVNRITLVGEDVSDNNDRFMKYRYYQYDITCSKTNLVKLAKATRFGEELLPLFNIYSTDITEDELPFDIETVFDEIWNKV